MDVEIARNILFGSVAIVAVASLLALMRRRRDQLLRGRPTGKGRTPARPASEPSPTAAPARTTEELSQKSPS